MRSFILGFLILAGLGCGNGGGGGGKVGVPACDDYLSKLDACASKLGGNKASSLKSTSKMMREAWAKSAKDSAQKEMLPGVCEAALDDVKGQVPECSW